MTSLHALATQPTLRVVGLMSGTSIDGVDAALVEIDRDYKVRVIAFETIAYDAAERARIFALLTADVRTACQDSFWLGEKFAAAAERVMKKAGVRAELVGSHGQTVWHQPPSASRAGQTPSTLQLGEPAVIAARTGLVTIADFRVADVALGGEGAPLVPLTDWLLYREAGQRVAMQNIGGIANVALLVDDVAGVIAFDNGPGNMMIDALAEVATNGAETFDRDGEFSARGHAIPALVDALMDDEYLRAAPPKSTGRERYGKPAALAWAQKNVAHAPLDLLATVVAFTARAIAASYGAFLGRTDHVYVSGGGAHNRTLLAELRRLVAPVPVEVFAGGGVGADAKEAVAFALLAARTIRGAAGNLPQVTGARGPAILGKICLPPL